MADSVRFRIKRKLSSASNHVESSFNCLMEVYTIFEQNDRDEKIPVECIMNSLVTIQEQINQFDSLI